VIGNYVGQIARFLLEIRADDYIITPASDTELLNYCRVKPDPSYFYSTADDGCPYRHRRRVRMGGKNRSNAWIFPCRSRIRSVRRYRCFAISQRDEFFEIVGRPDLVQKPITPAYDPYRAVLGQILTLDDKEFEILVGHLLTALGFEGSEVTGRTGDGGVDATGELNVANLAKVKVFVQAKRYKLGSKISASTVRQLRQAIPFGGQGAFITTADFQSSATDVALEAGFPRIGLINGRQLVELLIEHWSDIPSEFQERLGLKPGLVLA
jgi:restriction system protein